MQNKKLKNNNGYTLIWVLMVMIVLFILGAAIINMSNAETTFSARQYNRSQAYYTARSGAEIALKKLNDEVMNTGYNDVADIYDVFDSTVYEGSVTDGNDNFSTSFIGDGYVEYDRIKILSNGTHNGVNATTALTIQFRNPNSIPFDWLNPGQIMRQGTFEMNEDVPVVVNIYKLLGHAPKKEAAPQTTWIAKSIHFVDDENGFSLELAAKNVTFKTNLLSFKKKLLVSNQVASTENSFLIDVYTPGVGFRKLDGSRLLLDNTPLNYIPDGWGVVSLKEDMVVGSSKSNYDGANPLLQAGCYTFAPGTDFSHPDEMMALAEPKLIKITNASSISYIDFMIRKETNIDVSFSSYTWSRE